MFPFARLFPWRAVNAIGGVPYLLPFVQIVIDARMENGWYARPGRGIYPWVRVPKTITPY